MNNYFVQISDTISVLEGFLWNFPFGGMSKDDCLLINSFFEFPLMSCLLEELLSKFAKEFCLWSALCELDLFKLFKESILGRCFVWARLLEEDPLFMNLIVSCLLSLSWSFVFVGCVDEDLFFRFRSELFLWRPKDEFSLFNCKLEFILLKPDEEFSLTKFLEESPLWSLFVESFLNRMLELFLDKFFVHKSWNSKHKVILFR